MTKRLLTYWGGCFLICFVTYFFVSGICYRYPLIPKEKPVKTTVKILKEVLKEYSDDTIIIIDGIEKPESPKINLGEDIKNFEERKIIEL